MFYALCVFASVLVLRFTRTLSAAYGRRQLNATGIGAHDFLSSSSIGSADASGRPLRYRVIVLNLNNHPQRLQRFAQHLSQHPDLYSRTCRLPAIDGSDPAILQSIYSHGFAPKGGPLKNGMLGCYMSHWTALRAIAADESIDFGVVMEDDLIHYSPDFDAQFKRLWNHEAAAIWQRTNWVYLQMDGSGWFKGQNRSNATTDLKDMAGLWPKNTAMYAVSRAGAAHLAGTSGSNTLGSLMPIRLELDEALPPLLPLKWAFVPPIAQALHKDEVGGDTSVQFLQKQVPVFKDCPTQPL